MKAETVSSFGDYGTCRPRHCPDGFLRPPSQTDIYPLGEASMSAPQPELESSAEAEQAGSIRGDHGDEPTPGARPLLRPVRSASLCIT